VDLFSSTRSMRRIIKANQDLVSSSHLSGPTSEQYALFRDYIETRHADGGMADMNVFDYMAMVGDTGIDTRIAEYRIRNPLDQSEPTPMPLLAAALTDVLDDGLSLVYSFFSPHEHARSLGTYMILDHIRLAKTLGLPYVYLGYWVKHSQKMGYKARFQPQERLGPLGWERVYSLD
jgi:arginine-tRNA-protein transferase